MEFAIVDLSDDGEDEQDGRRPTPPATGPSGQDGGRMLGEVDTATVAAALEALRSDLATQVSEEDADGLRLDEVNVKLTLSAEGKVAFIAKGSAEACIEVKFKRK